MELNRLRTVICLGAMLLLMAGVAMAGTTSIKSTPTSPFTAGAAVKYAHEVGAANAVYTLPTQYVVRVMDVIRTEQEDFFIDVTLQDGARFANTITSAAGVTYAPIGSPATGAMTFSLFSKTNNSLRFHADVTTRMIEQGAVVISTAGWRIQDVNNRIGNGQTIGVKVETLDAKDVIPFDTGSNIATLTTGANWGVVFHDLTTTTPTIDVNADRMLFLGAADTTTPVLEIEIGNSTFHRDGNPFSLNAASKIVVTVSGDLTGIEAITWKGYSAVKSDNMFILTVDGDPFSGTNNMAIRVDGETALDRRVLRVDASVEYVDISDVADGTRDLGLGSAVLSTWLMNGTVLYTNWTNGNNASLNGRLYIWNPSSVAGAITAEVFTLPLGFGGSTKLGEKELGVLPATSGINLRVAEDILTPIGITVPYSTDGGNLMIRLTINAAGCTGVSSVFNQNFAYGVNPMVQAGIVE